MSPASPKNVTEPATHITLSLAVVNEASALGMNVSQTCERLLQDAIRVERERRWAVDNADFVQAYNQTFDAEGLPLAQWRAF
ncbi:type II toxin-antitoxin system CcdA family antitoxin [Actimicrobium sp. CCC2.4]|uniref:type II toxin-antitoxin system CcdA family antitoxin n=1 Tax=Actimicrobium sp. CCC2.4 TaxID=3048606 RepID=UPI002AC9969A|nr:type II toxin-antitoxin system CcdA family antitoxin [Actimicrobium sp. CCC2.4]MEB0136745.1 type II toxin-antitoxin system CcdA family antitoxin [Actimicrobium sp. CCC2.4]WPX33206.1 type II toxin-antitoxin system CcdA family antitoxin [Actimicrobium sp. CCC2.4]